MIHFVDFFCLISLSERDIKNRLNIYIYMYMYKYFNFLGIQGLPEAIT